MKDLKQFYLDNMETIRELEDSLFDLSLRMEDEFGGHLPLHEYISEAWNAIYNVRKIAGDVKRGF